MPSVPADAAGPEIQQHESLDWAKTSDPGLNEALERSISTKLEDGADVIEWDCPRCKGKKQTIVLSPSPVVALDRLGAGERARVKVECECDCGEDHEGRPPDGFGCGYGATIRFLA